MRGIGQRVQKPGKGHSEDHSSGLAQSWLRQGHREAEHTRG